MEPVPSKPNTEKSDALELVQKIFQLVNGNPDGWAKAQDLLEKLRSQPRS